MLFCREPGCYRVGEFGVRLENVLEVVRHEPRRWSSKAFLAFKPVTLVPYEPELIDVDRLTPPQRRWLNDYNAQIRHKVGAELKRQRNMRAFHWMMSKTGYIPELCPMHFKGGGQGASVCHSLLGLYVLLTLALTFWPLKESLHVELNFSSKIKITFNNLKTKYSGFQFWYFI